MLLRNLIQGFMAAIVIGVFHNIWVSARTYGGLIGKGIRYLGIGLLFIVAASIEDLLMSIGAIENTVKLSLTQDILTALGLIFLAWGFSVLSSVRNS